MLNFVQYVWRIFATALGFSAFGIGGLVLCFFVFPIYFLVEHDVNNRRQFARRLIQFCFVFFIRAVQIIGVLKYRIDNGVRLSRRGLIVVANHPTLLDVVFLVALVPDAVCIVKSSIARNIFMRSPVIAAQYIFNDGGAGLIEPGIDAVKNGSNLIIFPEGTRTPADNLHPPLKRGAANIAVRGGFNITPIRISCQPPSLRKGQKWYHIPSSKMIFTISVLEDININPLVAGNMSEALAARELTAQIARNIFDECNSRSA